MHAFFYFCICICSAQLSMFHMERRSRNTLIIIIIIINNAWTVWPGVRILWLGDIANCHICFKLGMMLNRFVSNLA